MKKLTLEEVGAIVRTPKKTCVFCHKNPDPDTLGSAFALKELLEYFGSTVKVACSDLPSAKFRFIFGDNDFSCNEKETFERYLAVDVASGQQLGENEGESEKIALVIDHHEQNGRFCDYYEDFCAATAEILYRLAKELGVLNQMNLHFYECVYAGISGDTGGFKYSNVTSRTHDIASDIVSRGIDHAEINRLIFDAKTVGEINAQKLTYEKMELLCDGKLAFVYFSNELKEQNHVQEGDISDIVNYIRCIDGVLVAVSLKQSAKDQTKFFVSSRANAEIDVSKVCAQFGGGGHKRASGATIISEDGEQVKKELLEAFENAVEQYCEERK